MTRELTEREEQDKLADERLRKLLGSRGFKDQNGHPVGTRPRRDPQVSQGEQTEEQGGGRS